MKPPSAAIRLLAAALPPEEREAIVGDLSEIYADRVEARRPFNRVWFWSQALGFLVAAGPRPFADPPSRRHRMERFTTRVRQTARRLAGDWRYSAGVIAILAVGIGPAAAMLSVVDKVLLRPLDYREPERLGLISGLVPVWRVSSASWQTLRAGSVQGGRAEGALSRLVLVGAQIALTVVLAFGSVQLTRSAARLRQVDLGFDPAVLTLRVPFDGRRFDTNPKRIDMYQRLRDRVRAVPGVAAAGLVSHVPLSGSTMTDGFQADMSKAASFDQPVANYQAVMPGYFAALRIPIRDGRDFTDQEDRQSRPVIVVDETLARTAFPGASSVIGRTLKLGWGIPDSQIVGVVGHVRAIEVGREVRPQIYAPAGQLFQPAMILTVRADGDPMRLLGAIDAAVREIGPGRATSGAAMLSGNVAAATSTLRAVTGLVTFLALSAGLLSAIGLYLVIAFVVHQQRRETAIRAALGASRRQVVWQHGKTSAVVLAAALPAGVLLSLAVAPLFADLVYGIGRHDPGSLALALAVATIAGVLGTLIPVSRVTTANVAMLLRGE